jgi:NADH dehydrogenase FAD-containing subunit
MQFGSSFIARTVRKTSLIAAAACTNSVLFWDTTVCSDSDSDSDPAPPTSRRSKRKKKYVIVGGGVAGRSCVTQLVKGGHDQAEVEKDVLLIDSNPQILHSIQQSIANIETTTSPIVDFSVEEQTIELASGEVIEFERCLLAMGKGTAKIGARYLTPHCSPDSIMHLEGSSSQQQLVALRQLVQSNRHVTLLGGSWNSLAVAR